MKVVSLLMLATTYCCTALNYKTLDEEVGPVVFVNILFRHGERTIIDTYPTDPYRFPSFWPLGFGQLTKAGIRHHYALGNVLGQRYAHLLPERRDYNHTAIRVLSTDVDRTLMSAEAHLAGMFPVTPEERWGGIDWQPVPIHTVPEALDKLLAMKHPCKRYDYEKYKLVNSDEYKALMKKYKPLGDYLEKYSGKPFNDLEIFVYFQSNLFIEKLNNYSIPKWADRVYDQLLEPAGLGFTKQTFTHEMKRLKGGPLIKEMLNNMKAKIEGTLNPPIQNVSMYSAHDTTVSNVLNTIGIFNNLPPPFASLVLVELRKTPKNENVVLILYKNSTNPVDEPRILTVPGCQEACPISQLETLLQPVIPQDWDTECHQHEFFDLTDDQPYNTLAIFAVVTSTLIVFLILALTSLYWTKQKPNHIYHKLSVETL